MGRIGGADYNDRFSERSEKQESKKLNNCKTVEDVV